jgi:hypothetical protein
MCLHKYFNDENKVVADASDSAMDGDAGASIRCHRAPIVPTISIINKNNDNKHCNTISTGIIVVSLQTVERPKKYIYS